MIKRNKKGFSLIEMILVISFGLIFSFIKFNGMIKEQEKNKDASEIFERIGAIIIKNNTGDNDFHLFQDYIKIYKQGDIEIKKTSISPSGIKDSGLSIIINQASYDMCNEAYKIPKGTKLYYMNINGVKINNQNQLSSECNYNKNNKIEQYIY